MEADNLIPEFAQNDKLDEQTCNSRGSSLQFRLLCFVCYLSYFIASWSAASLFALAHTFVTSSSAGCAGDVAALDAASRSQFPDHIYFLCLHFVCQAFGAISFGFFSDKFGRRLSLIYMLSSICILCLAGLMISIFRSCNSESVASNNMTLDDFDSARQLNFSRPLYPLSTEVFSGHFRLGHFGFPTLQLTNFKQNLILHLLLALPSGGLHSIVGSIMCETSPPKSRHSLVFGLFCVQAVAQLTVWIVDLIVSAIIVPPKSLRVLFAIFVIFPVLPSFLCLLIVVLLLKNEFVIEEERYEAVCDVTQEESLNLSKNFNYSGDAFGRAARSILYPDDVINLVNEQDAIEEVPSSCLQREPFSHLGMRSLEIYEDHAKNSTAPRDWAKSNNEKSREPSLYTPPSMSAYQENSTGQHSEIKRGFSAAPPLTSFHEDAERAQPLIPGDSLPASETRFSNNHLVDGNFSFSRSPISMLDTFAGPHANVAPESHPKDFSFYSGLCEDHYSPPTLPLLVEDSKGDSVEEDTFIIKEYRRLNSRQVPPPINLRTLSNPLRYSNSIIYDTNTTPERSRLSRLIFGIFIPVFILDFFFYGISVLQFLIIPLHTHHPVGRDIALSGFVAFFMLLESLLALYLIIKYPLYPKMLQVAGFGLLGLTYFGLAVCLSSIPPDIPESASSSVLVALLYDVFFRFFNYLPNATTFLIALEYFNSESRGVSIGATLATGRVAAVLGIILDAAFDIGLVQLLFLCSVLAFIATVCSIGYTPHLKPVRGHLNALR